MTVSGRLVEPRCHDLNLRFDVVIRNLARSGRTSSSPGDKSVQAKRLFLAQSLARISAFRINCSSHYFQLGQNNSSSVKRIVKNSPKNLK